LHERAPADADEPDPITAVLGPKPRVNVTEVEDFRDRIGARGGQIIVLNDEAHHTHDEESVHNSVIRALHNDESGERRTTITAQLDFTATPRHSKGELFSWTVFDYPLRQAILDRVVKRPIKGIAKGIKELPSSHASVKYQSYLTAGVERWKEY